MPVHVEELTTDVTVLDGDLPLSETQIERLVQVLLQRLDDRRRDRDQLQASTQIRGSAAPASGIAR